MKIIDQHGNPLDAGLLREPQTARVATLAHFMVESQLDGLTPAKAARILRQADQGDILAQHQLFDDMYDRDAHLRCEFDKRAGAVLKRLEASAASAGESGGRDLSKIAGESTGMQLSFFQLDDPVLCQLRDRILDLDINNLTPMAALNKLHDIREILTGKS